MKYLILSLTIVVALSLSAPAFAGPLADQKLLDFLQKNGALTEAQVRELKKTLDEEDKQAVKKQEQKEAKEVTVAYDDGLHFRTNDKSFDISLGGLMQTDLTLFEPHYPVKDDFDIRRARLFIAGRLFRDFNFKFEGEFEGSSNNRLVDAYMNYEYFPYIRFQAGQFKEPYSLEQLISDKNLFFNERSFGYYLTPGRDVGFMVYGNLLKDSVLYSAGVFNGDGTDAYRRGQGNDKQATGRLVIMPFKNFGTPLLTGLQLGGSFTYANLTASDFKINVKTPALTTFFSVAAQTKFNVLQDIGKLHGMNFDVAYAYGPLAIMGEFFKNSYTQLKYTDTEPFNFSLRAWYINMFYMLTGEHPVFKNGLLQGIAPKYNFDVRQCRWGALGIGFQYQQFNGSPIVYSYLVEPGDSVRRATSFTVALNWYLNQQMRISLDYSRTWFSQPLYYGTDPEGIGYYDDIENAWVTRFQLAF
jgi:phosphate-selective porin OprO and OprP